MFVHLSADETSLSQDPFLEQYRTNANLCRQYIKLASERLYLQEATRISQANTLLEKLSLRPIQRAKELSQCDGFTTRDSLLPEDLSLSINLNLSNITERQGTRVLTRRSNNPLTSRTSRDFQGNLSQALTEVEHTCSARTSHAIRKLLEDFRKLKVRSIEHQKKEKAGRHLERLIEDLQEKNIMLGQRLEEAEGEIERLRTQGLHLREENKELAEVLFQKMNQANSERKLRLFQEIALHRGGTATSQNGFQLLAEIISQKESIINTRLQAAEQIEARIQQCLFGQANWNGACLECCGRLRRLKKGIFAYRESLQEEGRLFERMFDACKERLLQGMQLEE